MGGEEGRAATGLLGKDYAVEELDVRCVGRGNFALVDKFVEGCSQVRCMLSEGIVRGSTYLGSASA